MKKTVIELDSATINKIAAGEVIERPASVVKELVENAIDANATTIQINIQDGGKKLIQIIDNGKGMNHDDALLAIKRHTTSKIRDAEDLFDIKSLGFRGEALASIVSVGMVEILTRNEESELGTRLVVEGGKIVTDEQISAPVGTKISVRNLFFNVPVRRKFLKTTSTEMNHITETITKLALAKPQISFSLTHNDKNLITAPKGDLLSTIAAVFGKNIAKAALPVSKTEDGYFLEGLIIKPEFSRKSKDYMYIFANRRPITDKLIADGILAGFGTTIPHGSYPMVFLFFNLPTNEIDVNVHPTKREVRFENEGKVYSLFETTIQETLHKSGTKVFERVSQPKTQPTIMQSVSVPKKRTQSTLTKSSKSVTSKTQTKPFTVQKTRKPTLGQYIGTTPQTTSTAQKEEKLAESRKINVFGIIKKAYIIAETQEGLLLCDQHAAAEKVNYLKYLHQVKNDKVSRQQLLAPVAVQIKPSEKTLVEQIEDKLQKLGFDIEQFGKSEVVIRTVPTIMGKTIAPDIAREIMDILKEYAEDILDAVNLEHLDIIKDLVALKSCRRSIKAGDKISLVEAEKLIEDLLKTDDPWTCPHGRPTAIILNEKYLEELFGRDYR